VSSFDSIQKVFADHSLDSLPIVWTDGVAGLKIRIGGVNHWRERR
jgi:hypothetical protein